MFLQAFERLALCQPALLGFDQGRLLSIQQFRWASLGVAADQMDLSTAVEQRLELIHPTLQSLPIGALQQVAANQQLKTLFPKSLECMGWGLQQGWLLQRIEHLQLCLDAFEIFAALELQGDAAFGGATEGG